MANSHPGSYCGQDAYTDMLVVDDGNMVHRKRTTGSVETQSLSGCAQLYARPTSNNSRGGEEVNESTSRGVRKGGDGMKEVSAVVRRLTPL